MARWGFRRIGSTAWPVDGVRESLLTERHRRFVDAEGFPPGRDYVECRGLDARGLPKFRVRAGRREVRA